MSEIKQENIAYVASTLPIAILGKMAKEWRVGTLLVASHSLAESYKYLINERNNIRIIVVPQSALLQIALLMYHLVASKLFLRHVYFFHECCCLYFDILIGIIKPTGSYFPQVTLSSFVEANFSAVGPSKIKTILILLRLNNSFTPYFMDMDDDKGSCVIWARSTYPQSINKFSIEDSRLLKLSGNQRELEFKSNNILFLFGSDVVKNSILQDLYTKIIDELSNLNYRLYAKDHPNPDSRLNISDDRLIYFDPHTPAELLKEQFDFAVGTASTGLLLYQDRAISILRLVTTENEIQIKRRINHLASLPSGGSVNFPCNIKQLIKIIMDKEKPGAPRI